MGGHRTAAADQPTGGASQGRPPDHQRHHPRAQSGVPLAGLSGGLWPTDDDLQSLSSLGATRDLAATVCRTGDDRSRRHPDDRQYHCQGTSFGGWRERGADLQAYKLRNLIERMFCRLRDWRRIATRYDKLATNFAAAAIVIWWL